MVSLLNWSGRKLKFALSSLAVMGQRYFCLWSKTKGERERGRGKEEREVERATGARKGEVEGNARNPIELIPLSLSPSLSIALVKTP